MRALWLSVTLVLTGCADVCTRAELQSKQFRERHAACFPEGTLLGPAFDAERCGDSMNACSADDERAVQAYFDCVEALDRCTPETRSEFNEAFLDCTTGMNRLSAGCFAQ